MKKPDYKQARKLGNVLAGLTVAFALLFGVLGLYEGPMAIACLVLLLLCCAGVIALMLLFYRCPHCGERWNSRMDTPAYCPHCGEKIPKENDV